MLSKTKKDKRKYTNQIFMVHLTQLALYFMVSFFHSKQKSCLWIRRTVRTTTYNSHYIHIITCCCAMLYRKDKSLVHGINNIKCFFFRIASKASHYSESLRLLTAASNSLLHSHLPSFLPSFACSKSSRACYPPTYDGY